MLGVLKVPEDQIHFVTGSEFQLKPDYTMDMYRLHTLISVRDAKHAGAQVVKQTDNPTMTGLMYPTLQALDEQYLDVDAQLGGVDQRKIFTFAQEILPKIGHRKRAHLMTPMVPGLRCKKTEPEDEGGYLVELCGTCVNEQPVDVGGCEGVEEACLNVPFLFDSEEHQENVSGDGYDTLYVAFNDWLQIHGKKGWFLSDILECYGKVDTAVDPVIVTDKEAEADAEIQGKMSASDEKTKLDMLDFRSTIKKKLASAYCLPGDVTDNSVLDILEKVLFPLLSHIGKHFEIFRREEHGGPIVFETHTQVRDAFEKETLHPRGPKGRCCRYY